MTVVVTGASGHIGLNLVRALVAEKRSVRAMVHHNHQVLDGLGVEIVTGDVTDMASLTRALEGADVVYHLAGVISLLRIEWPLVEKINMQGTRNVIEACRNAMSNGWCTSVLSTPLIRNRWMCRLTRPTR